MNSRPADRTTAPMESMHQPTTGSALTGSHGVDVAIDNVGTLQFEATQRSLATNGRRVLRIGEEQAA